MPGTQSPFMQLFMVSLPVRGEALWRCNTGRFHTGFMFKLSQCTRYSSEWELGVWLLTFGRGDFLHSDFSGC